MTQEWIVRVQGNGLYGLGKVVVSNVALFEAGFYDLTKEELNAKLKALKKAVLR